METGNKEEVVIKAMKELMKSQVCQVSRMVIRKWHLIPLRQNLCP